MCGCDPLKRRASRLSKLVVNVRSLLHATSPVQDYSLLENYMVHYVYPTWSAQPHRGVGDAPACLHYTRL